MAARLPVPVTLMERVKTRVPCRILLQKSAEPDIKSPKGFQHSCASLPKAEEEDIHGGRGSTQNLRPEKHDPSCDRAWLAKRKPKPRPAQGNTPNEIQVSF